MLFTTPGCTAGTCQVCTTLPSVSRIRSTSTETGEAAVTRYENVTPLLDPAYAMLVLVPVSSCGPPGSRGPGTGVSCPVLGGGGGAGRIVSEDVAPLVVTV